MARDIRVLVIDDSPAMRQSIVFALQKIDGLSCVEASDGAEGVKKLGQIEFHAVVCDINMPVMDGLKVIHHMRQTATLSSVPIVVITTETGEEDRRRALALGANRFLVKPVRGNAVVEAVKQLLRL